MKTFLVGLALFIVIFLLPWLCRRSDIKEINQNTIYVFAEVYKITSSLKNGNSWHYRYKYKNIQYEDYKPTDINYDIRLGDWVLIKISSLHPGKSILTFKYALKESKFEFRNSINDTFPYSLIYLKRGALENKY